LEFRFHTFQTVSVLVTKWPNLCQKTVRKMLLLVWIVEVQFIKIMWSGLKHIYIMYNSSVILSVVHYISHLGFCFIDSTDCRLSRMLANLVEHLFLFKIMKHLGIRKLYIESRMRMNMCIDILPSIYRPYTRFV
jgi:hypothetical protein